MIFQTLNLANITRSLFLAIVSILMLSGFTFDESVLGECGKEHPNDFIGRFVCNGRVEGERKEKKSRLEGERKERESLTCVYREVDALTPYRKNKFTRFLNENANEDSTTLIDRLKTIGYSAQLINRSDDLGKAPQYQRKVITFSDKINCETKAKVLFNLFIEMDKPDKLLAWTHYPEPFTYGGRISELTWSRAEHREEIDAAIKLKAQKMAKQQEVLKLQNEEKSKQQEIERKNAEEAKQLATRRNQELAVFLIYVPPLGLLIFLLYFYTRKKLGWFLPKGNESLGGEPSLPVTYKYNFVPSATYDIEVQKGFRSKFPYVELNVRFEHMAKFIEACDKHKVENGYFPNREEQHAILAKMLSPN